MIDRLVDRWDGFADRFRVVISIVGGAWLALICADYAGFITLPQIAIFEGFWLLVLGAVYNALWWGVLYPRVMSRRQARTRVQDASKGSIANG